MPAEGVGPGRRLQEIEGAVLVVARSFAFGSRQVDCPTAASPGHRSKRRTPAWHRLVPAPRPAARPTGFWRKSPTLAWAFNSFSTWRRSSASPRASRVQKGGSLGRGRFFQGREQQGFHSRGIAHDRAPRKGSHVESATKVPETPQAARDFFQNYSWWSSSVSSA